MDQSDGAVDSDYVDDAANSTARTDAGHHCDPPCEVGTASRFNAAAILA